MTFKKRYLVNKEALLNDKSIHPYNIKIIKKFLEYEEYKLTRKEGLVEYDERSAKTLLSYIRRIRQVNEWLGNKDWRTLKKSDFKKLVDNLEDGVIKTKEGNRHSDRSQYYQLIQGKLFGYVKKNQYAKEIFSDFTINGRDDSKNDVRFVKEETVRKIVDCCITPEQKLLVWLAFDIGENIGSLLELKKADFRRQTDSDSGEPEYLVVLSKDNIKRKRTPRTEPTNFRDTVKYLDIVLENVKPLNKKISNKWMKDKPLSEIHDDDKLFKFGRKAAALFLRRAVEKANARCIPGGQPVTWKDLRSSMACDLLIKEWSTDEINARLGHKPSSRVIDKYVTYLALNRKVPKKKIHEGNLRKLEEKFEKEREANKLKSLRIENLQDDFANINSQLSDLNKMLPLIKAMSSNKKIMELAKKELAKSKSSEEILNQIS